MPATTVEGEPVDLLHATHAALATSSAYHDDASQIARLADGDLATSWNSRTGDLVGAWIDFAVPADATVTSLAMTAGYTHTTEHGDLFTGNHRVSRVRVLREGAEIGAYDLDPENRDLQVIPAAGAGGHWRIEVVGIVPGARTDWRETCISELRVMGRAPTLEPGQTPSTALGALPDPSAPPAAPTSAAVPPPPPDVLPAAPRVEPAAALATIARTLAEEQITQIERDDDVAPWLGRAISLTSGTDRSGTWGCVEDGSTTRCFTLETVTDEHTWTPSFVDGDAYEADFFRYDASSTWWYVHVAPDGSVSADRRDPRAAQGTPPVTLPVPASRPAPAWLASLRGLDVTSAPGYVAVTASGWLSVCRRGDEVVCTPGVESPAVRHRVMELHGVQVIDGDRGLLTVGVAWYERRGPLEDSIDGSVLVTTAWDPPALRVRATMVEDALRQPIDVDDLTHDPIDISYATSDVYSESCWLVGGLSSDPEGLELARAPDTIPVGGVGDPFTLDVQGSWTILPGGGLRRRSEPCVDEDEEEEEADYDDDEY